MIINTNLLPEGLIFLIAESKNKNKVVMPGRSMHQKCLVYGLSSPNPEVFWRQLKELCLKNGSHLLRIHEEI
jgi:hypothetical protein